MKNLSSPVVRTLSCDSSKQKQKSSKPEVQIPEKKAWRKKGDLYLSGKYTCIIMHCIPIENLKNILEGS